MSGGRKSLQRPPRLARGGIPSSADVADIAVFYRIVRWRRHLIRSTEARSVSRTEAPIARKNYHVDGILIVAGQSSNYYIRFPNSPFESLRGGTPDEVYGKYLEAVALRPMLAEYAEKYVTPEMSDAEFIAQIEETKRAVQQARVGPGKDRRPGNE